MSYDPEQALACAVILQAIRDFKSSSLVSPDDVSFLLGQSPESAFWFPAAGFEPLTHDRLFELKGVYL